MSSWSDDLARQRRMMERLDHTQARRLIAMLPARVQVSVPVVQPGEEVAAVDTDLETAEIGGQLVEATAPAANALTALVRGPLVRAGQANLNGAYFSKDDLLFGLNSIAGGPLTVNHLNYACGWIESAELKSQPDLGDYVDITGRVWHRRFGEVWRQTESAIVAGTGALSMECVPSEVACMADGCGIQIATMDKACAHILKRSAPRRMVRPVFYGAALVLPPEKPGWPDARLSHG